MRATQALTLALTLTLTLTLTLALALALTLTLTRRATQARQDRLRGGLPRQLYTV